MISPLQMCDRISGVKISQSKLDYNYSEQSEYNITLQRGYYITILQQKHVSTR